ncbi:hypothetical protein GOP47_0007272 [Adiantum capillus-veneris]|uniref:Bromo domain-containing protein n=1 Tax=Adiantum capillus-veneris TaxID=13818 RepID=A0A9D4V194_ADICA|nr:hypothetical protein GOP47_0007272 [Adiantum capillus-veneris]
MVLISKVVAEMTQLISRLSYLDEGATKVFVYDSGNEVKQLKSLLHDTVKLSQSFLAKLDAHEQQINRELGHGRQTSQNHLSASVSIHQRQAQLENKGHHLPASASIHQRQAHLENKEHKPIPIAKNETKRALQPWYHSPAEKRQKFDDNDQTTPCWMRGCAAILKRLEEHTYAWIFLQPVDAVKLNLPDYHKIITNPMDLGTVKQKLERNEYTSLQQFAKDVRLTFANAKKYNPKDQDPHFMAHVMSTMFETHWKTFNSELKQLQRPSERGNHDEEDHVTKRGVFSPTTSLTTMRGISKLKRLERPSEWDNCKDHTTQKDVLSPTTTLAAMRGNNQSKTPTIRRATDLGFKKYPCIPVKNMNPMSRAPDIRPMNLGAEKASIISASTGQTNTDRQRYPDRIQNKRLKNNKDSDSNESSSTGPSINRSDYRCLPIKGANPASRAPDIPPVNLAADRDSTGQQRIPNRRPKNNEDSNSNESSSSDSTESSSTGPSITEGQAIHSSTDLQELDKITSKMPDIEADKDQQDEYIDIGGPMQLASFPPIIIDTIDSSSSSSSSNSGSSSSSSSSSGSDTDSESDVDSSKPTSPTKASPSKETVGKEMGVILPLTDDDLLRPTHEKTLLDEKAEIQGGPTHEKTLLEEKAEIQEGEMGKHESQVAPGRLLRGAILKNRFADIILKSQGQLLQRKQNAADPGKLKREWEELQKQKKESMEAEAKRAAAIVASTERLKREADRQAARQALQQLELAVEPPVSYEVMEGLDPRGSFIDSGISLKKLSSSIINQQANLYQTGEIQNPLC